MTKKEHPVKARKDHKYIVMGTTIVEGVKAVYIVQQTGQRSWEGSLLSASKPIHNPMIKGNAGTVLQAIARGFSGELEIHYTAFEQEFRMGLLEVLALGTVGETAIKIVER